jgi:hypothetical protein
MVLLYSVLPFLFCLYSFCLKARVKQNRIFIAVYLAWRENYLNLEKLQAEQNSTEYFE